MRFVSRRNKVYLKDNLVLKKYAEKCTLQRERENLTFLRSGGLEVPEILGVGCDYLTLSYLPGSTYADCLPELGFEAAKALGEWLSRFHLLTDALRGDVNFRNFIWDGKTCYGVDFEEAWQKGPRARDYGRLLAYGASYRPVFSRDKLCFLSLLLQEFQGRGGDVAEIRQEYMGEIQAMQWRRPQGPPSFSRALQFFESLISAEIK